VGWLEEILEKLNKYSEGINTETIPTSSPPVQDKPKVPVTSNDDRDYFDTAVQFVLEAEGDYSNNPADPGGETKYGISKKSYPRINIKALTLDRAKEIYREDYWNKTGAKIQDISPKMAILLFDTAVNMGVSTAIRLMQRALHVKEDGVIGPVTRSALEDREERECASWLLTERLLRYTTLPTWRNFSRGWTKRVASLALYVGECT